MIASCVAMSTVVFSNLAIASAFLFAMQGKYNENKQTNFIFIHIIDNVVLSTFFTACATYLNMFPVILIFAIALIHKNRSKIITFILFATFVSALLYMSYSIMGHSWDWIKQSYLYVLAVRDLTPNWGNAWYV